MQRILILVILIALQLFCLNRSVTDWYANRDNTLFANGQWKFGKDQVKYVFQTYKFMFEKLQYQQVALNQHGGYQELYWHEQLGPERHLREMNFETLTPFNYLWVILGKQDNKLLGARFSRHSDYPSGFFSYDDQGRLVEHTPFVDDFAVTSTAWARIKLEHRDGHWIASYNDREVGRVAGDWQQGQFGLRGCQQARASVLVRDIHMHFVDPTTGRSWSVHEQFKKPTVSTRTLQGILLFALLALTLRHLRNLLLALNLTPDKRLQFACIDTGLFCLIWLICHKTTKSPAIELGNIFLFTELVTLVGFAVARPDISQRPSWWNKATLAFATLLVAISCTAFLSHGEWLGRAKYRSTVQFAGEHPDSFIKFPNVIASSPPLHITEPIQVSMSQPWFSRNAFWNEQTIRLRFTLEADSTLHLVWNQQQFVTHGDPHGEPLPLMRRLLQLSTRDDLTTGMSVYVERRPHPFEPVAGEINVGTPNDLEVRCDARGTHITLNGATTLLEKFTPLGFGETGLLAYHAPATIESLHITPSQGRASRERLRPLFGFIVVVGLGLFAWLLLRPFGTLPFTSGFASGTLAATLPAIFYLTSLFFSTREFAYLADVRLGFLDIAWFGAMQALCYTMILHRHVLRLLPLPFFLVQLLAMICIFALFFDRHLPPNHELKLRTNEQATAPATLVTSQKVPYYANNTKIGANLWIWRHRFEGKSVPVEKPADRLRIFVIGGSQAWGSGAASSSEIYSELVEHKLQAKGLPVDITNAAINGSGVIQLQSWYEEILRQYQPDILVANMGLNDATSWAAGRSKRILKTQYQCLEKLLAACQRDNCTFLWVKEPMNYEASLRPYPEIYAKFEEIVSRHNVPILETHEAFKSHNPMHMYWFDSAHLAPAGQILLAEHITPALEKLVRQQLQDTPLPQPNPNPQPNASPTP